jgi:hypothetical protein
MEWDLVCTVAYIARNGSISKSIGKGCLKAEHVF